MNYKDKDGNVLYGFSVKDMSKIAKWLKVLSLSVALLVIFLIVVVLWLKFSGIGHNIIYELSRCGR